MTLGLYKVSAHVRASDGSEALADFLVIAATEEVAEMILKDRLEMDGDEVLEFLDVKELGLDRARVLGVLISLEDVPWREDI
uniref:Uncharacterized protein n=1 Tax=Thermococcus sp. AMT11 TaxID=563043 RepID=C8BNE5_9EURY|nr:unknown [Thermococcus sp. AMT11]